MDTEDVRTAILGVEGVSDVHHLHLWNLASDIPTLSAQLVVKGDPSLRHAQRVVDNVRSVLAEKFALIHTTLEIECTTAETELPTNAT